MRDRTYWTAIFAVVAAVVALSAIFDAQTAIQWIAFATLPMCLTFIWIYASDGWHRSWFGRSLMLLAVSVLAYTFAVVMLRTFGPGYALRAPLLVVATGGTLLAMLLRTMVLWSVKSSEKHHLKDKERPR